MKKKPKGAKCRSTEVTRRGAVPRDRRWSRHHWAAVAVLPLGLFMGCGPPHEQRQQAEARQATEQQAVREGARQKALLEARGGLDASEFPPDAFDRSSIWTIDLQRFFREHPAIIFEAWIEDVEESEDGYLVELSVPLSSVQAAVGGGGIVSFRLKGNMYQVESILMQPRKTNLFQSKSVRYLMAADCVAVARIDRIAKVRERRGAEAENGEGAPARYLAEGALLRLVPVAHPRDEVTNELRAPAPTEKPKTGLDLWLKRDR